MVRRTRSKKPRSIFKISDHFSRRDFTCKCGNCKKSIKLSLGLVGGLELLRSKAKKRINILKGFECIEAAEKHGKVKRNYHIQGLAAEIDIDTISLQDAFKLAEEVPEFGGIGLNLDKQCLHVDTRKDKKKIWVQKDNEEIEITDKNRTTYLNNA